MKKASITEAKNSLSALIDGLRGGSSVLIVDRGRPVARLQAVTGDEGQQDGRLARLVRDGLVRHRRIPPPQSLFSSTPPQARAGASSVDALIEERRDGR